MNREMNDHRRRRLGSISPRLAGGPAAGRGPGKSGGARSRARPLPYGKAATRGPPTWTAPQPSCLRPHPMPARGRFGRGAQCIRSMSEAATQAIFVLPFFADPISAKAASGPSSTANRPAAPAGERAELPRPYPPAGRMAGGENDTLGLGIEAPGHDPAAPSGILVSRRSVRRDGPFVCRACACTSGALSSSEKIGAEMLPLVPRFPGHHVPAPRPACSPPDLAGTPVQTLNLMPSTALDCAPAPPQSELRIPRPGPPLEFQRR